MADLVAERSERAKDLPPEDRARLAEELLASLEGSPSAEVDAAWNVEIQRRIAEVEQARPSWFPPKKSSHASARISGEVCSLPRGSRV